MELTGKAKEDFEKYIDTDYNNIEVRGSGCSILEYLEDCMIYPIYIDFFDSVGLNITLTLEFDYGYIIQENRYDEIEEVKKWYNTRDEATKEAIIKANEIYNNL